MRKMNSAFLTYVTNSLPVLLEDSVVAILHLLYAPRRPRPELAYKLGWQSVIGGQASHIDM